MSKRRKNGRKQQTAQERKVILQQVQQKLNASQIPVEDIPYGNYEDLVAKLLGRAVKDLERSEFSSAAQMWLLSEGRVYAELININTDWMERLMGKMKRPDVEQLAMGI